MASSLSSVLSSPKLLGSETPRIWTPPLRPLTRQTSRGWECIEFAEDVLEITMLPWQKWLLIHALEINDDGTFRFRTVLLLVARQSGKSTLMQVLSLWRMYIDAAPLIIGTAQNLDIAEEVWQGAVDMAEDVPDLAAEIEQVFKNTGKKYMKLTNGSRYKVQAAGRRGGRGLSGDLVLLDELREHQNWEAWSAVANTTMAREFAQVWAASNAGDGTSVVLAYLRKQAHRLLGDPDGINGGEIPEEDDADGSLGIFEWSAVPGLPIEDRAGWAQANPSLGYTIQERALVAAMVAPEAKFRTENLCQWVDSMREGAFPPGVWEANKVDLSVKITGTPVVAVDIRTGMDQTASIVVAGSTAEGFDMVHVVRFEPDSGQQVVDHVLAHLESRNLTTIVLDKYGENTHLIPMFEDAGIKVIALNTMDMRAGATAFSDALINGRVKHHDQVPLNVAVLGAGKQVSEGGFRWSWAKSITDITSLRAATAAWWVHTSQGLGDYDPMSSFF